MSNVINLPVVVGPVTPGLVVVHPPWPLSSTTNGTRKRSDARRTGERKRDERR